MGQINKMLDPFNPGSEGYRQWQESAEDCNEVGAEEIGVKTAAPTDDL
jgi:hypothetical protein